MRFSRLIAVGVAILPSACIPPIQPYALPSFGRLDYDVGLTSVQRPAATQQRYGEQTITPVKDSAGKYRFEDRLISATFIVESNKIGFALENRSDYPIQVSWTEAAFVDPEGQSQPVMHTGVKYTDCSSPKAPSVIVPKGRTTDVIVPCNYVKFGYSTWLELDYLPNASTVLADSVDIVSRRMDAEMKGKTIQVLLPIKTQDVVNDYTFTFKINGVSPAAKGSLR